MKPLTIEELKNFKAEDFIWLVKIKQPKLSCYCNHISFTEKMFCAMGFDKKWRTLRIEDYGTNWLAYKNKEQAENKDKIEVLETALDLCEQAYLLAVNGKQNEGISIQAMASDLGIHKFFLAEAEKRLDELKKD